MCQEGITVYDTAREVFAPLGCWERYQTAGFKELAVIHGVTEQSYPRTSRLINRIRHQEGATSATTVHASVEREGKQIVACVERTTTAILPQEGFDETGPPVISNPRWSQDGVVMCPEQVQSMRDACELAAEERAEVEQNPVIFEQPTKTVNISIDDVVVKQQKPHRIGPDQEDEVGEDERENSGRPYVHTTVAHRQHQDQTYCITGRASLPCYAWW